MVADVNKHVLELVMMMWPVCAGQGRKVGRSKVLLAMECSRIWPVAALMRMQGAVKSMLTMVTLGIK